jgi:hypothetical protein
MRRGCGKREMVPEYGDTNNTIINGSLPALLGAGKNSEVRIGG